MFMCGDLDRTLQRSEGTKHAATSAWVPNARSHVRMGTGAPLLRAGRVDPLQGLHLCLGHGPDDGQVRVLLIKLTLGVVHPHLPTTRGGGGCTQVNKSARGTVWVQRSL